jgi:hypothetical protein
LSRLSICMLALTALLALAGAGCGSSAWQGGVQTVGGEQRGASRQSPLGKLGAVIRQTNTVSSGIISADRAFRVRFER